MTKINHQELLNMVIVKYENEHGQPGLAKADVDAMAYGLDVNKGDIYKMMDLGMRHFFKGL